MTDLSEIPAKHGVKNVYADLGQIFAQSTIANPKVSAAMMAQLVQGLGADHVVWGTDAIWTGSPQWQIEALRRLEVPEDMQKKYGFKPLGPADGPIKTAILGENNARLYKYDRRAALCHRPRRRRQGGLRGERRAAQQPPLRLRRGRARLRRRADARAQAIRRRAGCSVRLKGWRTRPRISSVTTPSKGSSPDSPEMTGV